jgi:VWFA-related protein
MTRLWLVLIVAALAPGGPAAPDAQTMFRSGVDLVGLNVVVTDRQGRFIGGLGSSDFAVFENGVEQDITFFAATPVPIDLAILLDTSASMSDKIATVQQAAVGFISAVRPGDRVTVVDIKDTVRVLHPLDDNVADARAAILATTPRGNTSLYNGLYMTLKDLAKHRLSADEVRRQAMVVLSDGADTSSLVSYDDLMELAKQAGVAIYTITLRSVAQARTALARNTGSQAEADFSMKALARETGARAFFPAAITELAGAYGTIADELASQYSLGYSSRNPNRDGAYRRIVVRIERPGTLARTRAGYVAVPQSTVASR